MSSKDELLDKLMQAAHEQSAALVRASRERVPTTLPLVYLRDIVTQLQFIADHGEIEERIFEHLVCDGCGLRIDLRSGLPDGWTSTGSIEQGWDDRCPRCTTETA